MPLTCPQCAAHMNEVKAEATTGYFISLDQCPRCGGIWCDRWELYPVTAAAAERLDPVDQTALWQPVAPAVAPLRCPRCQARMVPFHDPQVPADAHIERCLNCEGMWLNRGDLRRYKLEHARQSSSQISSEDIDTLSHKACSPMRDMPTVEHFDTALEASEQPEEEPDLKRELLSSAMWVGARALLGLLLHL